MGVVRAMGGKSEGVKKISVTSYKTSDGDVKSSLGNKGNNTVITMHGVRHVPNLLWCSFQKLCV